MNHNTSQNRLPIKIIRGGSSKGIFVRVQDLPPAGCERDLGTLRLFGTPDIRQIDGLGGGDKLTSKMAVMAPPTRSDCDISYLFAQVGTEFPDVDWDSNCGNISAGAALFAAIDCLGRKDGNLRHIAIEQANTGRRLLATVPLSGNQPAQQGEFAIGGVPGTGPRINLDFADFVGSSLNRGLFPTGVRQEHLNLSNSTVLRISIIDMANLNVLVWAEDLDMNLTKNVGQLQMEDTLLDRLDQIRTAVMLRLGMASTNTVAQAVRRSVNPLLHLLTPPQDYRDLNGMDIPADTHDLLAWSYSRRAFSKAYPGTGAIGTAIAARIKGTVADGFGSKSRCPTELRIGHPSGYLSVDTEVSEVGQSIIVTKASIGRTARLLLEGTAYLA